MAFRLWRMAAVVSAVALVGAPSIARSQCAKDTDCKGARICSAGQCVGAAPTSTVRDWSLAGGIVGVVGAGLTIGFSIPIEFSMDDPPPAPIVLAGISPLLTIVAAPIAAGAGRSARRAAGVKGEPGARIGGWIFYGLDIMFMPAMALVSVFAMDGPPPHGWMTLLGLGGALSQCLLAADAFIAHSQAKALAPKTAQLPRENGIALAPLVAPYATPGGGGAVVGLAGSF